MVVIQINNIVFRIKKGVSILEACRFVGIDIPRFCYHEILPVSGNCRMCLIELKDAPKPLAGCALPVSNKIRVFTDTPLVKKGREHIMSFLLLNHPLDCPVCDRVTCY
jgi:NADH dehydrogenase/NADH:ubiquinone oxidoreductase subunit G